MKLEADMRLDADGTSTSGDPPVLLGIEAENGQTIDLAIVPGTSMARVVSAGFGANSSYTDFSLPRDGTWHAVSMKVSFNQDGTLNLLCGIDGQDHSLGVVAGSQNLGKVTIVVGARGTTTSAMEVYFDDVVIDG